ncbi:PRELI domain-containing protein 2-like isoform X2 [Homarus americanus]|uniref:PRELI domain-containing protein 2-like isoform X2 n=1 Tax=Homarus americanus TaxID=6706 RepID=UPI001C47EDF6|nr:PRELI domain-containing protein 2-like isoform X2 [Homarus americanus]
MTVTVKAEHVYQEPVEVVAVTHLSKYPNEYDPNILSCAVLERKIDGDGQTYTKRVAAVRNVLPSIFRRVKSLQVDHFELQEESWYDRRLRKLSVRSHNISVSDWITMREASVYTPHQQNPNWTNFEQEGTITVHGLGRLGCLIEMFGKRCVMVFYIRDSIDSRNTIS